MALKAGDTLGRYEIRSLLGVGGMGEVYLARDPKIGRDVAIKVLPASVVGDSDRLARFEQEAQAAGSLNHPNILSIYDIDTENGTTYVVSELLKGETLREAMGTEPLPIRKALNYALQAAHGLAAAHEKGIIHRDVKPENLMITSDGRVKILDFGLAKLTEFDHNGLQTDLPTRKVNTDTGSVMGTAGYMSPEQLRGQPVDPRTDIFSFGTVLYEMLSGRKAFQKDSTADTISAILREDPPELSETNSSVDSGLERIVHRCLEKNREERFHSASDLGFALEALAGVERTGAVGEVKETGHPDRISKLGSLGWLAAVLLLVTTVVFAYLYLRPSVKALSVTKFEISAPSKNLLSDSIAISPDGRRLAMVLTSGSGETALWIRAVDSLDSQRLGGTEGSFFPFWSPDSRTIAFFAGGKLKKIDASGGPVQSLTDVGTDPRGGTWAADGRIVYTPNFNAGLYEINANGGVPKEISPISADRSESSHRWPYMLPDGKHYLFFARSTSAENEGVSVGALDSAETKFLFQSKVAAIYAPESAGEGDILFVQDGMLISRRFDSSRLQLDGDPVTVAQDVLSYPSDFGPTGLPVISAANNGTLVYRVGGKFNTQLRWVDRNGKYSDPIGQPGSYHEPMVSPDGKRIVISRQDGTSQDLFLLNAATGAEQRFTFDPPLESSAVWDRTGANIIYSSADGRASRAVICRRSVNGGKEEVLYTGTGNAYADSVSPDGKYLLFEMDKGGQTKFDLFLLPLEGEHTPIPLLGTPAVETHAQFSPDGKWFSYASDQTGRAELYVRRVSDPDGGQWQISLNGGDQALWNPKGGEIFYIGFDRKLYSVPFKSGDAPEIGTAVPLFDTHIPITGIVDERNNYLVMPDGQHFLTIDLVDESRNAPLVVVLNWHEQFR